MIKFFRNIRKNQLKEGNTGSYLKYAFGEILLVVIGILIALSINNWNQNRQNNKILTIYTNQLIEEVELNISKLNKVIEEESKLLKHLDTLVDILKNKDLDNPKLTSKSFSLLSFEDFYPETIAFENLKSSGEFKLIENIDLRNSISSAYNSFESIYLTHEVHYFNMKTRIADYFFQSANFIHFNEALPNFGKDREFGNLAIAARSTLNQKIDACEKSQDKMKKLKKVLESFRKNEL